MPLPRHSGRMAGEVKNYRQGERPPCPEAPEGRHDDAREWMEGHAGDGTRHHGYTDTCGRCGMREFVILR